MWGQAPPPVRASAARLRPIFAEIFTSFSIERPAIGSDLKSHHLEIRGYALITAKSLYYRCTISWHAPVYAVHSPENTRSKVVRLRLT